MLTLLLKFTHTHTHTHTYTQDVKNTHPWSLIIICTSKTRKGGLDYFQILITVKNKKSNFKNS